MWVALRAHWGGVAIPWLSTRFGVALLGLSTWLSWAREFHASAGFSLVLFQPWRCSVRPCAAQVLLAGCLHRDDLLRIPELKVVIGFDGTGSAVGKPASPRPFSVRSQPGLLLANQRHSSWRNVGQFILGALEDNFKVIGSAQRRVLPRGRVCSQRFRQVSRNLVRAPRQLALVFVCVLPERRCIDQIYVPAHFSEGRLRATFCVLLQQLFVVRHGPPIRSRSNQNPTKILRPSPASTRGQPIGAQGAE